LACMVGTVSWHTVEAHSHRIATASGPWWPPGCSELFKGRVVQHFDNVQALSSIPLSKLDGPSLAPCQHLRLSHGHCYQALPCSITKAMGTSHCCQMMYPVSDRSCGSSSSATAWRSYFVACAFSNSKRRTGVHYHQVKWPAAI